MANNGSRNIANVADNAPGFFSTLPEFAEAVASKFIEPANKGSIENVSSSAPMFCSNSPALDSVMKNGGTVTNSKTMFAFRSDPDQTGAFAA